MKTTVDCLDARLSISPPHKVRPSSENHLIWGHDLESKDDNSKTTSRALLGVASHMYIYIYTYLDTECVYIRTYMTYIRTHVCTDAKMYGCILHAAASMCIWTRRQKERGGLPEREEETTRSCLKRSFHLSSSQAARSTARTLVSGSMPV